MRVEEFFSSDSELLPCQSQLFEGVLKDFKSTGFQAPRATQARAGTPRSPKLIRRTGSQTSILGEESARKLSSQVEPSKSLETPNSEKSAGSQPHKGEANVTPHREDWRASRTLNPKPSLFSVLRWRAWTLRTSSGSLSPSA